MLTLKVYYHNALRRKSRLHNPSVLTWIDEIAHDYRWVAALIGSVWAANVPAIIRALREPGVGKRDKVFRIVDRNGNPVRDAKIYIDGRVYSVDSYGTATVKLFVEQSYHVRVLAPGYELLSGWVTVPSGTGAVENTLRLEPLAHPDTGEAMPEMSPEEVVEATPTDVLEVVYEDFVPEAPPWWERPELWAAVVGVAVATALATLSPIPGDEAAAAYAASAVLADFGVDVGWLELDERMSGRLLDTLRSWIGI